MTVGGDVSIGGTVTYEDVTNIDSVGIVTAGKGFRATTGGLIVTAGVATATDGIELGAAGVGGTMTAVGNAEFAGIVTATSFSGDGSELSGIESWNQQDTWLYGGG